MIEQENEINLSKIDRQRVILNLLSDKGSITLNELEDELSCSRITIQRDLVELEKKGMLGRVHGGATSKDFDLAIHNHKNRLFIQTDKKKKIAKKAINLIKSNTCIFLDASSTVFFMSEHIFPEKVQIVTTGFDTFLALQNNAGINPILTGGRINPENRTLVGPEAILTIKQFFFKAVFISADSVVEGLGVYSSDAYAAEISWLAVSRTEQVYLLFDTSKVKNRQGVKVCDIEKVTKVITDDPQNTYLSRLFKGKVL